MLSDFLAPSIMTWFDQTRRCLLYPSKKHAESSKERPKKDGEASGGVTRLGGGGWRIRSCDGGGWEIVKKKKRDERGGGRPGVGGNKGKKIGWRVARWKKASAQNAKGSNFFVRGGRGGGGGTAHSPAAAVLLLAAELHARDTGRPYRRGSCPVPPRRSARVQVPCYPGRGAGGGGAAVPVPRGGRLESHQPWHRPPGLPGGNLRDQVSACAGRAHWRARSPGAWQPQTPPV